MLYFIWRRFPISDIFLIDVIDIHGLIPTTGNQFVVVEHNSACDDVSVAIENGDRIGGLVDVPEAQDTIGRCCRHVLLIIRKRYVSDTVGVSLVGILEGHPLLAAVPSEQSTVH